MSVARSTYFLNTYDIFGKSIPGGVLIGGIYYLVPFQITLGNSANTQFDLILQVLTAGLIGLLIGEAIHSLANIVERVLRRIGRLIKKIANEAESNISSGVKYSNQKIFQLRQKKLDSQTDIYLTSIITHIYYLVYLLFRLLKTIATPGNILIYKLYPALQPHRVLFTVWIKNNYGGDQATTWDLTDDELLRDQFADACEDIYNIEIVKKDPDNIVELYTMVTAIVNQSDTGLSQRFQDLYSFCRSMWVVLLIILLWFSLLVYTSTFSYNPWWMSENIQIIVQNPEKGFQSSVTILLFGLAAVTLLFLYASSKYKQIYIKYLISDVITIYRNKV